jgi:hypothetical protein
LDVVALVCYAETAITLLGSEEVIMQSIDELARTITQLDPSEQQALMEKVSRLNSEIDRSIGTDARLALMQEAMKDELFLEDLHEVMDDFRHVDSEAAA